MRTAHAAVLREANPAVRWKLASFDLVDRRFDQPTELTALFLGDRGFQILDLRPLFSHEHNEGDVGNATNPGIANEPRI